LNIEYSVKFDYSWFIPIENTEFFISFTEKIKLFGGIIGKNGVDKSNVNGERFVELC
jgi:hypothetical protein